MSSENNKMNVYRTVTGLTLAEALEKMIRILPPEAYKGIGGATDFTDISPHWLTKVATDSFGACGIGWFYNYDLESVSIEKLHKTSSKGREYDEYDVLITYFELVFVYFDEEGNKCYSATILSNGGSANEDRAYALRGAITNAIGSAFAKLLWQIKVYMGYVDHNNAKVLYDKQEGKTAKTTTPAAAAEKEKAEETQKTETPKPETPAHGAVAETSKEPDLALVIPSDVQVPLAGQTLEAVTKNALLGEAVLKYLTGEYANAAGHKFVPETDEQKALQEAVKKILASGNYKKPNKK